MIYNRNMMEFKQYMNQRDMSQHLSQSFRVRDLPIPPSQSISDPQLHMYAQQQAAMLGQGFGSLVAGQEEMNEIFKSGFGAVTQDMGQLSGAVTQGIGQLSGQISQVNQGISLLQGQMSRVHKSIEDLAAAFEWGMAELAYKLEMPHSIELSGKRGGRIFHKAGLGLK
jgi:hypothetical protein